MTARAVAVVTNPDECVLPIRLSAPVSPPPSLEGGVASRLVGRLAISQRVKDEPYLVTEQFCCFPTEIRTSAHQVKEVFPSYMCDVRICNCCRRKTVRTADECRG